jgi:hypothetical protein
MGIQAVEQGLDALLGLAAAANAPPEVLVRIALGPHRFLPKDPQGILAAAVVKIAVLHPNFPFDHLAAALRPLVENDELLGDLYDILEVLPLGKMADLVLTDVGLRRIATDCLLMDMSDVRRDARALAILGAIEEETDVSRSGFPELRIALEWCVEQMSEGFSAMERLDAARKLACLSTRNS